MILEGVYESVIGGNDCCVSGGWQNSGCMSVVSHSHHGCGRSRNGGSWLSACRIQPGGVGNITGDACALPVCEVGTLLTYDWTDVELKHSVAE